MHLEDSPRDNEGLVLSYFVGIWLKKMGYGSREMQKYVGTMVKIWRGEGEVLQFMKIYKHLDQLKMEIEEQRTFLVETCRNGWPYFVRFLKRNVELGRGDFEKMEF